MLVGEPHVSVFTMDLLSEILDLLRKILADYLQMNVASIKVISKNRALLDGDFQVPLACLTSVKCDRARNRLNSSDATPTDTSDSVNENCLGFAGVKQTNVQMSYLEDRIKVGFIVYFLQEGQRCGNGRFLRVLLRLSNTHTAILHRHSHTQSIQSYVHLCIEMNLFI